MFRFIRRTRHRLIRSTGRFFRLLFSPFYLIRRLASGSIKSLVAWWYSRKLRDLLFGLPALGIAVGAITIAASGLAIDRQRIRDHYLTQAEAAFHNEQFKAARLLYQRAIQDGELNSAALFKLAICCEKLEDFPAMEAIVGQLAPLSGHSGSGFVPYAPAHLRQATEILRQRPLTAEMLQNAEVHLRHVVKLDVDNESAHRLLGEMCFQRQDWQEAVDHFLKIAGIRPEYNMTICRAYMQLKDSRSVGYAETGRRIFLAQVESDPTASSAYILAADANLLLGNYRDAAELLTAAIQRNPENQLARQFLSRNYVEWAASLRGETRQERVVQLDMYSQALTANPDEALVYDGLANILVARDETSLAAEEFLVGQLAEGKSVGICHLLLSLLAESRGDLAQCELHLSRAFDAMPNAALIANNLAWVLAMKENPDPERALVLINRALEQAPNSKRFLDTRGQIYVKQKNWSGAVADLERTMPEFSNKVLTHMSLAQCYEHLGDPRLAAEHRRRANQNNSFEIPFTSPSPDQADPDSPSPLPPAVPGEAAPLPERGSEVPPANEGATPPERI